MLKRKKREKNQEGGKEAREKEEEREKRGERNKGEKQGEKKKGEKQEERKKQKRGERHRQLCSYRRNPMLSCVSLCSHLENARVATGPVCITFP